MSTTFHPKKSKAVLKVLGTDPQTSHVYEDGGYDMNVAGREAMTSICTKAGFLNKYGDIWYVATQEQTKEGAEKLKVLLQNHEAVRKLYRENTDNFSGSLNDFREWIQEFATFLEHCGGYEAQ